MKKTLIAGLITSALLATSANASVMDNVGVGLNYGLVSAAGLELTYPISESFQIRGSVSTGMSVNETTTTSSDSVRYGAKADGGIHRIAIDFHPMQGSFFLSAGYAINNFEINAKGKGEGSVSIGDETFNNANVNLKGAIDWDNAPTLTMGWGHSPSKGWGGAFEIGAILTGSPNVKLSGTGDIGGTDVSAHNEFLTALSGEERKLKDEISSLNFLPIVQAGVTYRF